MSKWIWCNTHNHQFDEDEGCEYCYEIWKIRIGFIERLKTTINFGGIGVGKWISPGQIELIIKELEEKQNE